ncbi:MAG: RNA polymerase sigma factor, partial [Polyangiales bacterium]
MSRHATPHLQPVPAIPAVRERSFDVLYESLFDFVFRCLRRLGVAASHAEDACQDVFIVLHRRLPDLRPDASERAFLFGIATRVAGEYRRKQARRPVVGLPEDWAAGQEGAGGSGPAIAAVSGNPFEVTASAEAAHHLERFLALLDADQRAVFMLIELEELSAPEVG